MGNFNKIVLDDETLEVEDTKARTDIGDVSSLQTTTKESIVKAVNECFRSASDGKALIASAITGMGVNTDSGASFAVMAGNIAAIETGVDTSDATAGVGDILSGKIAYGKGSKLTGTMANNSTTAEHTAVATLDNTNKELEMTVPKAGYYSDSNKLKATFASVASLIGLTSGKLASGNTILGISGNSNVVDTSTGTATAAQILSGYSAYVKGVKVNGTATLGKKYASGTAFTLGTHPNASMIYYRSLQDPEVYSRNGSGATIAINPGFTASVLKAYYVRLSGITAYYYTTVLRYDGTSFHFDCIDDVYNDVGSQELGYSCYFQNYAAPRVGNTFYLPHSHLIDVIEMVSWEAWE